MEGLILHKGIQSNLHAMFGKSTAGSLTSNTLFILCGALIVLTFILHALKVATVNIVDVRTFSNVRQSCCWALVVVRDALKSDILLER